MSISIHQGPIFTFSAKRLNILIYVAVVVVVVVGVLHEFPLLQDKKFHRTQGRFAYYSQQIYNYSSKIHPLSATTIFPGTKEAEADFYALKDNIENSVVWVINENPTI